MTKPAKSHWQRLIRAAVGGIAAAVITAASFVSPVFAPAASAASGDRTLYLYYTHTRETAKITFKRNGRYDKKALAELNHFLRDWRRDEPTKMDPALFDLIWEVYQEVGNGKPVHVVSAYRAPATNNMLRSKSSGVAKNSRHTTGQAMDFFIPGVPISKLRAVAMKKQVGGVGYYPSSGSPFVHLDTGNVRAWPRMTKAQLQNLFPDGKTLHLPTNGVPLSKTGYQYAKAQWVKCHTVPCRGSGFGSTTRVASNDTGDDGEPKKTLLGWLFNQEENDDDGAEATVTVAAASSTATRAVAPASAPVPHDRPHFAGLVVANAPFPAARPRALITNDAPHPALFNGDPGTIAVAAIEENTVPEPRALFSETDGETSPLLTAYAPADGATPTGIAAASATATAALPASQRKDTFQTASVTGGQHMDALGDLIESTWSAVENDGRQPPIAETMANLDIETRRGVFHAPDLEHVAEIFTDPRRMNGARYAVIFQHDEADFSPATELGSHAGKAGLKSDAAWGLGVDRFAPRASLLVAAR